MMLGGIGAKINPAPVPGCFQVFIGSDSEGKFGHNCQGCDRYWRGEPWTTICPYCGNRAAGHEFLSKAQLIYIRQYIQALCVALGTGEDGEFTIDMDAVADAAGESTERPAFFYADEAQQNKFICDACGCYHDVLGRFVYCSRCGTRNDLQELETNLVGAIRARIEFGEPYESRITETVSTFDSFARRYAEQLVNFVPMTPRRKALFARSFHDLRSTAASFKEVFDIDILDSVSREDAQFAELMFHRRHVYEHKGGEADEKYIADSGDRGVRPRQTLHESRESAHRLASVVVRMTRNLHRGFHDILPPEPEPIERKARLK